MEMVCVRFVVVVVGSSGGGGECLVSSEDPCCLHTVSYLYTLSNEQYHTHTCTAQFSVHFLSHPQSFKHNAEE